MKLDHILSKFIYFYYLFGWGDNKRKYSKGRKITPRAALFFTAGVREAWEEMRLSPFKISLLGKMAPEHLVLFDQLVHPFVVWVMPDQAFQSNWEVARIIHIPVSSLLNYNRYGRFFPKIFGGQKRSEDIFPCFFLDGDNGNEILWGASYRITMRFLKIVFGFEPPPLDGLPLIERHLNASYLNGSRWKRRPILD